MADDRDAKVQLIVAEYTFVTGLIRFYRELELRAQAGTGLVLTAVAAAIAALEAAERPNRVAEGLLLTIGAWVPAVLVLIAIVALTRGLRAVVYVETHLHPLAARLLGDNRLLAWEVVASAGMHEYLAARQGRAMRQLRFVDVFVTGTPIILSIAATSVLLAVAGCLVDTRPLNLAIGGTAAAFATLFAAYGRALGTVAGRSARSSS